MEYGDKSSFGIVAQDTIKEQKKKRSGRPYNDEGLMPSTKRQRKMEGKKTLVKSKLRGKNVRTQKNTNMVNTEGKSRRMLSNSHKKVPFYQLRKDTPPDKYSERVQVCRQHNVTNSSGDLLHCSLHLRSRDSGHFVASPERDLLEQFSRVNYKDGEKLSIQKAKLSISANGGRFLRLDAKTNIRKMTKRAFDDIPLKTILDFDRNYHVCPDWSDMQNISKAQSYANEV